MAPMRISRIRSPFFVVRSSRRRDVPLWHARQAPCLVKLSALSDRKRLERRLNGTGWARKLRILRTHTAPRPAHRHPDAARGRSRRSRMMGIQRRSSCSWLATTRRLEGTGAARYHCGYTATRQSKPAAVTFQWTAMILKTITLQQLTRMISDLSGLPVGQFVVRGRNSDGYFDAIVPEGTPRPEAAQANLDAICARLQTVYRLR